MKGQSHGEVVGSVRGEVSCPASEDYFDWICFAVFFGTAVMSLQLLLLLSIFSHAFAQSHVAFDRATASSLYSNGAYSAGQALSVGSGYWCRYV